MIVRVCLAFLREAVPIYQSGRPSPSGDGLFVGDGLERVPPITSGIRRLHVELGEASENDDRAQIGPFCLTSRNSAICPSIPVRIAGVPIAAPVQRTGCYPN